MVKELLARDVMSKRPITVEPTLPVKDVTRLFAEKKIEAAPVVENGRLIGMVSDGDLIMQEVKLHFPTYIQLLEGYIYLGSLQRFEDDFRKAIGARVEDVMSTDIVTVGETATLQEVATLMEKKHLHTLPVIDDGGGLLGTISKSDIVRAIAAA